MICALASMGFINEDIEHNKTVILNAMLECAGKADLVLFGEAFLQGFYGATFDAAHDRGVAVSQDDAVIHEIPQAARRHAVAVSFGFIETLDGAFYSSQITIGSDGRVLDAFRRVSPGWKEPFADGLYREGDGFHAFQFGNQRVLVGLCGDLWCDERIGEIKALAPDIILWPSYTDYGADAWNHSIKHEYAEQAGRLCSRVLYVNSCCLDKDDDQIAKGGAAFFLDGRIAREAPAGREAILFVEIPPA